MSMTYIEKSFFLKSMAMDNMMGDRFECSILLEKYNPMKEQKK